MPSLSEIIMAHDVFISYSSKDFDVATAACQRLETDGIPCWMAPRDIEPGTPYGDAIIDALNVSHVMVLIFSSHSNDSPQVEREVERAVSKGITVIPFRIENPPLSKTMEYFISVSHWLEAETGPIDGHLARLSTAVRDTLSQVVAGSATQPGHRPEAAPSAANVPNNLTQSLTSFIGREDEIGEALDLLETARVLTLVGPGGTGKTRLAVELARRLQPRFPDGVWQVELAPVTDPALVPQTVLAALSVQEVLGRPVTDIICDYARSRKLLLVIDNCEHLIAACARFTQTLTSNCPNVHIVATSREALAIQGEVLFRVPTLSLPPVTVETERELMQYESAKLFVERARAAHPDFVVGPEQVHAIADICRRLDGIPLALELAAARVKAMPVDQIASHLDQAFRLLTGGSRGSVPRHQTLREMVDWSYDLLSDTERTFFNRLSVFNGLFTLDAAQYVCSDANIDDWQVLDLLTELVDKSLVEYRDQGGEGRYQLLETMRQYANEKECGSGEDYDALRSRHRDWFVDVSRKATVELRGPDQRRWIELLDAEYGNVRSALDWCLRETDAVDAPAPGADKALEMATNFTLFWLIRGYMTEGIDWLERSLKLPGADHSEKRIGALHSLALLWHWHGNGKRAEELSEEIIALGKPAGEKRFVSLALTMLAVLDMDNAQFDRANEYCEEGIALSQEAGDNWGYLVALHFRGFLAMFRGDLDRAETVLAECIEIARKFGDWMLAAHSTQGMAGVKIRKGDIVQAKTLFLESLKDNEMLRYRRGIAECLDGLAQVAVRQGDAARAAELFGAVEALEQAINIPRQLCDVPEYDRALADVKAALTPTAFTDAWDRGRCLPLDEALAYAREGE